MGGPVLPSFPGIRQRVPGGTRASSTTDPRGLGIRGHNLYSKEHSVGRKYILSISDIYVPFLNLHA